MSRSLLLQVAVSCSVGGLPVEWSLVDEVSPVILVASHPGHGGGLQEVPGRGQHICRYCCALSSLTF